MTRRAIGLLLLGAAVLALAQWWDLLLAPAAALLLAVVVLIVVDVIRAPRASSLTAARTVDEILSVGAANAVTITIDSTVGPIHARVRDEWPTELLVEGAAAGTHAVRLPARIQYTVTPRVRGSAHFGDIVVRANGPLGLGFRQSRVGSPQTVRVDADLSAISRYDALVRRGHLADLGVRSIRRRAEGTEFDRVRDAVPDDPLRVINWRATARTGHLMATDYMPERTQPVIIVIDHGRLMGVGSGAVSKLDASINAAALLAHVVLRSGDRVGLFAFADRVTAQLPPRTGRLQLRQFLDAVRPCRPEPLESDYDACLLALDRWQRRRALIVIFTDVIDPDQNQALVRQCLRLRRRHLPLVITVQDPSLLERFTEEPANVRAAYERSVAYGLVAERQSALERLRLGGVETIDADARTLSPRLVSRYLDIKRSAQL